LEAVAKLAKGDLNDEILSLLTEPLEIGSAILTDIEKIPDGVKLDGKTVAVSNAE
jgi:hypothetical protein